MVSSSADVLSISADFPFLSATAILPKDRLRSFFCWVGAGWGGGGGGGGLTAVENCIVIITLMVV